GDEMIVAARLQRRCWSGTLQTCRHIKRTLIMKHFAWLLVPLFAAFFVRIEVVADAPPEKAADVIYHHAKILTMDEKFTIAAAIAVKGDKILAVGDDDEILKLKGAATKVVDMNGKTMLPGLYDS